MLKLTIFLTQICFLMSCNVEPSSTAFNGPTSNEIIEDGKKCDFTSYKPVVISHYVRYWVESKFKPEYPEEAFQRNIQGLVRVKIIVDKNGNVVAACALSGDKLLQEVSEKAAKRWKFKVKGGERNVRAQISFLFKIKSKKEKDSKGTVDSSY